jgi:hypothetical protein
MANKKLLLGMLTIALVLGMTVAGCSDGSDNEETNPSPPTGLTGICVAPNNSIQLTWNPVNRADEYWIRYKESSDNNSGYRPYEKTKTTSYTFTDLDYATKYDFQVAVRNTDGFSSKYSSPISVETGNPLTGSVSLSMETLYQSYPSHYYTVNIRLLLSDGAYWNFDWDAEPSSILNILKSWVTMTGTPNVSSWINNAHFDPLRFSNFIVLSFSYQSTAKDVTISGLTASLNTAKLAEMKSYTNIINTLSAGSPSTVSSSAWKE